MVDRTNQKQRTRRDLLTAARDLALDGRSPTIAEVAEAAGVSTATAYRYFPNPTSLWVSADAEEMMPTPADLLAETDPADTTARVDAIVRGVGWVQLDDEVFWRNMARASLERWFEQEALPADERVPIRSEGRMRYVDEALVGLTGQLPAVTLERLRCALAMVVGMNAVLALRDSCALSVEEAKEVMQWAASALVTAAQLDLDE